MCLVIRHHYKYRRHPLSRIPVILNFHYLKLFFGPFSTLGNCCYNFVRYLAPRLVKLFSWSIQRFPRLFSIRYHERFHFTHSNVQRTTSKTLIEHLSLYFIMSVKQKLNVRSLNEKYQFLRLRKFYLV